MQEMEEGEMNPEQLQGMQAHMPSSVMQNQMQQQHLQQLHRFWYAPLPPREPNRFRLHFFFAPLTKRSTPPSSQERPDARD
jgi:hypothetical protein